MRLPDGFLDDLRDRLPLSQVVGRKVTWDMRKTNQGRGDWWAPCPFHEEKTPSFHVDDRKGFYYCFGCQAKGNVFGFVQQTENVSFMEAVEILAAEAGMTMPARAPGAREATDRRARLSAAVEEAARWFRLQLATKAAAEARLYLDRRGVAPETRERFGLGFAPDAPDALTRALGEKGIPLETLVEAGLAVPPEGGRPARDRFIHRIVFPIRDARDRAIGFGGRAMNPNARAKYLNSPETPLFDKGANLYNLGPARAAVGRGAPLLVAEGYMDVIALAQAGFEGAVAPLGTAVTERQLRLLWRVSPEPVVALDGDEAGQRAGLRLADLALPLIAAGQSLRFATLPGGRDPDDLVREGGAAAMQAVLDRAEPMIALLWRRATEGRVLDSPERRAALDRDLRAMVGRVADPALRRHWGEEVARLRQSLFGPARRGAGAPIPRGRRDGKGRPAPQPTGQARTSDLASGAIDPQTLLEQVALAGFLRHPSLVGEFASLIERTEWRRGDHARIAGLLLLYQAEGSAGPRERIERALGARPLETLLGQRHVAISPVSRDDLDGARACVRHALDKLAARLDVNRERMEGIEDIAGDADEALTWRVAQAARRAQEAQRAPREADAGAEGHSAHSDYLARLIEDRVWEKTRKR